MNGRLFIVVGWNYRRLRVVSLLNRLCCRNISRFLLLRVGECFLKLVLHIFVLRRTAFEQHYCQSACADENRDYTQVAYEVGAESAEQANTHCNHHYAALNLLLCGDIVEELLIIVLGSFCLRLCLRLVDEIVRNLVVVGNCSLYKAISTIALLVVVNEQGNHNNHCGKERHRNR